MIHRIRTVAPGRLAVGLSLGLIAAASFAHAAQNAGAGAAQSGDSPPARDAAARPTQTDGPKLKLLDAGEGEKRELRYAPEPGTTHTLQLGIRTDSSQTLNGSPMPANPPMDRAIEIVGTVESVDAEGQITMLTESSETGRGGSRRIRTRMVISPRGEVIRSQTVGGSTEDTMVAELAVLLPEEPVGQGAKWEVVRTTEQNGIGATQTMTFTVRSIDDEKVELTVEGTGKNTDDVIRSPRQPDRSITIDAFAMDSEGELTLDLRSALPRLMEVELNLDVQMTADTPQMRMQIGQVAKTKLELTTVRLETEGKAEPVREE